MRTPQYEVQASREDAHWWHRARRKIMRDLVRHVAPPSQNLVVADIGCGTGGNLAELSGAYQCVGVDPSEEAISLARARFPEIRFIAGPVPEGLGAMHASAGMFLLMDVLEHIADDREFLKRLVLPAKSGAFILIMVPAKMTLWTVHDQNLGHLRRYERSQLEGLWKGLPVMVRLFSFFNSRLYPAARVARAVSRWRQRAWGEGGTDIGSLPGPLNKTLESIFAGETKVLIDLLEGRRKTGYTSGVSLIALLQRE